MAVAHDLFGWVSSVVDENFLRGDQDIDRVAVGFDVESAVGGELQQVQTGEVASRVVEEHVFAARIAGIDPSRVLRSVPAVDCGVVLHARIAAVPGGFGNFVEQLFGFEGFHHRAIGDGFGGEVGITDDGVHEVVGDAHAIVGVLEEDAGVGVGVGMRAVVSHGDERVRLGFFFLFAFDEFNDVGMVDVEDDHLGGSASLAAGLDDAGEGVEPFHKAERTTGGAAAGKSFCRAAQGRQVRAGAAAPLEQHAFGLGESEDGVERVLYRVDEASGALGFGVSGDAEFDLLGLRVPVPAAAVRVGLDAIAAHVEPYGRVERGVLAHEDMDEFVVEGGTIFGGAEIALCHSPVADGFGDAGDQLADSGFALGSPNLAVQIFAGHDVGGSHRPVFGYFDVFLLEDHVALRVGDLRKTEVPFNFVVRRDTWFGEEAADGEARSSLLGNGDGRDGGVVGYDFKFCHGTLH